MVVDINEKHGKKKIIYILNLVAKQNYEYDSNVLDLRTNCSYLQDASVSYFFLVQFSYFEYTTYNLLRVTM